MNKYLKKAAVLSLVAVMGTTTLTGCGKLDGTQNVATLGEDKVSLGTASVFLRLQQAQITTYFGSYMGAEMWTQEAEEGKTYAETTKDGVMDSVEEYILAKQNAAEYNVTLSDEDMTAIKDAAKAFIEANDQKILDKIGITEADVVTYLELTTYQNRVKTAIESTVDTEVSEEEAAQSTITYVKVSTAGTAAEDGTTTELTEEEKTAKKDQAQQVLDKVIAGGADADMDALAKEVDENLAATAGSFGKDDTTIDDAVKTAVKELADGTVADAVIEGTDGYYVARMDSVKDEKASEDKKAEIIENRKSEAYQAKLDEWKEATEFTVDKKVWAKAKIENSESYTLKVAEQEETPEAGSETPDGEAPTDDAEEQPAE